VKLELLSLQALAKKLVLFFRGLQLVSRPCIFTELTSMRHTSLLDCLGRDTWCKEKKKNYASSKKLLASIKEKGPLGKKSPFTRKEKGGQ